jgi:hypothetical protein
MTPDTNPDSTLSAFFADQTPPRRDLAFEAQVAAGIARRRVVATIAALLPWTIAASVCAARCQNPASPQPSDSERRPNLPSPRNGSCPDPYNWAWLTA